MYLWGLIYFVRDPYEIGIEMRWRSKAAFFDTVFVKVKFSGFCFQLCLIVYFDPKSCLNIGSFFFLLGNQMLDMIG